MGGDRLGKGDVPGLAAWALAAAVGIVVAISLFQVALPEAAVEMRVGPQDSARIARDFLRQQGFSVDDAITTTVLDVDRDAQFYLQRELPERASALIASDIPVFAFKTRFVRDQQQEEWAVRVDPAGRVVGMSHLVEEARPSARLEREEAFAVAERWLGDVQPDLGRYALVPEETQSTERPARLDWTFTWERADLRANDAPYRMRVTVRGDAVGAYEQGLRVPDAFHREFARLRSENFLYYGAAQVLVFLLLAAAVVTVVRSARRGAVRWRRTAVLLGILATLFIAFALNGLPLALALYDTKESYAGFALQTGVSLTLAAVFMAALTALMWTAGEPLYRERWPERLRLSALWRPGALRSKESFKAIWVGLASACAGLGFVIAFYVVGAELGVWAPQDVRYSDVLGTPAPWLAAIAVGVVAATFEEFLFRLFAIPFLLRATGSRIVAVVAPAVVWSFLHATYPFEPGYVRGIELGIVGVAVGLVFLRWGIIATLTWHYAYNAGLSGIFLVRSGEAYLVSASIVAVAVLGPLAVLTALYLARGRFRADASVLNAADPVPAEPARTAFPRISVPYETARRGAIAAILAVGVGGLATFALVPAPAIGDDTLVSLTPDDALVRADELLRERGLDPAAYQRVATFGGYPTEVRVLQQETGAESTPAPSGPSAAVHEYLRREVGISGATALYASEAPLEFWRVRYFRDAQPEDHVVLLRADGATLAVWRRPDEAAPGASLTAAEALAVAERYLREEQRQDLSSWRVVESASEKLPARTDHRIVFERLRGPGDARVRAEVRIADRVVSTYRTFVKIPEEWERSFSSRDLLGTVLEVARALALAGLGLTMAVLFFRGVRRSRVPWRTLTLIATAATALPLLSTFNEARGVLAGYTTDLPLATYLGLRLLGQLAGAVLTFGGVLVLLGAAWMFLSRAIGEGRITPARDPLYFRDALLLGLGLAGTLLGLARVRPMVETLFPGDLASAPVWSAPGVDAFVPALGPLANAVLLTVIATAIGAALFGVATTYVPRRWALPIVALGVVLFAYQAGAPAHWAKAAAVLAVQVTVVAWLAARVVRGNLLAYALGVAAVFLIDGALDLASQPAGSYQLNAAVLVLALIAMFVVPLALSWRTLVPGGAVAPAAADAPR